MTCSPGSGERCLCGSGRPFDVCCAAVWRQRLDAERRLVPQILDYADLIWGPDLFRDAWRMFLLSTGSAAARRMALPWFEPWLAFSWIPRLEELDDDTPAEWPTAPLGVMWLMSQPESISDVDRRFVVRATESPYSLLLVESATRHRSLAARDLLTGRSFVLADPEISPRVSPETILVSAVLTIDGVSTLLGPAPFALPSEWRVEAMEIRDAYAGPEWMTREDLELADGDISSSYLKACDNSGAPCITLDRGTDSAEPLLLRWTVIARFDETVERLRAMAAVDEENVHLCNGPDGAPHGLFTWSRFKPSGDPDDYEILGYLYLEEGRISADVPSRRLARTLVAEVSARLGASATLIEARQTGHVVRVHDRKSCGPVRLTER